MAFQRRFLFAGVKAEDIFLRRYTQRLNDLAAGIAARLLHHGAVLRLHLNGANLEQHGHGQVDTGGDHGQQGHKSHQTPHHPPPFQRGAGQAAFLAFFPPHRVPDLLLLRRAQALIFVALAGGSVCRLPGLLALGPALLGPAGRAGAVPACRRRAGTRCAAVLALTAGARGTALGCAARLGGKLDAVVRPGPPDGAVGRPVRRKAQRLTIKAIAAVGAAGGLLFL